MAKSKGKPSSDALGNSVTHLLHRALQLALDYHTEAAGPGAVTQRQYTVLAAAGAHDGLTQNDLVRATGIDRSTLADLVARMLVKGLLVRERSTTDARANSVRLSETGRMALAVGAGPASAADNRLLSTLSAKKREGFMKTLVAVASAADAPAASPGKSGRKKKTAKGKPAKVGKAAKPARAAEPTARVDKKRKKEKRSRADVGV